MASSWASWGSEWRDSLAASVQAAGEVASSRLREASELAQEKANTLKKTIEDELSSEYQKSTASSEVDATAHLPPPRPPQKAVPPTALERVTQVGVALLSPLDDAGGTSVGPAEPERVR